MESFTHFVITRFNIKSFGWKIDKNGQVINDISWLHERYDLFNKYCFPSMISQTEKNFKWLVFFDADTPQSFKAKNKELANLLPQFKACYVKDYTGFLKQSADIITKNSETDFIITTRFDNDDCFHTDAVKTIQDHFIAKNNTIIDLMNGLTMKVGKFKKLAKKTNIISGPFVSYIEKVEPNRPIKTVYDSEHTTWASKSDFIEVNKGFFWLQIIHNRNISNKLHDDFSINKKLLKGFVFKDNVKFSFTYCSIVILQLLGFFRFYYIVKRKLTNP